MHFVYNWRTLKVFGFERKTDAIALIKSHDCYVGISSSRATDIMIAQILERYPDYASNLFGDSESVYHEYVNAVIM